MMFVLVHGGGCGARCWLPLLPHLGAPAIVPELPGRGARPVDDPDALRIADYADAVITDIEDADATGVVLVGHSMAGLSMPMIIDRTADRLRHVVFVSCAVPADGATLASVLTPDVAAATEEDDPSQRGRLDPGLYERKVLHDMDDRQRRFMLRIVVPEPSGPVREAVSLAGLAQTVPRTWVRLRHDRILPPQRQDDMAIRTGCSRVVDLEAGHMAMVSCPRGLARILNDIHDSAEATPRA